MLLDDKALEAVGGRKDEDALIATEGMQVVVARGDRIDARGQGAGEHGGVIGVAQRGLFGRT